MKEGLGFLDLLVPPQARQDPRRRLRHLGIAKALLAISGVVAILLLAYVLVRRELPRQEAFLFSASILSPLAGALFIRLSGRISLGLFLTNLAGICIVALWCGLTGGIRSVALPWFLPNLFVLSTFGNRRMLLSTAALLVLALAALFLATQQGWLPLNPIPAGLVSAFALLSMLSSIALVIVVALMLTGERETSKRYLRQAMEAAEAGSRAKSAFLTSMSHELRTPLNAVMISADLLKEDRNPRLSPQQVQVVDQILLGGQVLLDLVNQVIEFRGLETGNVALKLERIRLAEALAAPLGIVAALARRREVQIDCPPEPLASLSVLADPLALRSVLINLLTNAVKFNSSPGQVFVTARKTDEGSARIEVRDTGPGIPDALREAAFQPFNRLGAEGLQVEGTGLGLAISDRLVRLMAGSLGCTNVEGGGSLFWVALPLAPDPPAHPVGPSESALALAETPPATSLRVLVAEDHPVNQKLLRRTLEKWGHRVTVVANGREALDSLERPEASGAGFDIILMDLLMPEMDGLEATRRIRQREAATGTHLPIVAVTACATDTDRDACFEAGMDGYLTKPFKPEELAGILRQLPSGNLG